MRKLGAGEGELYQDMSGKAALIAPLALLVSVTALAQQDPSDGSENGLTPEGAELAQAETRPGLNSVLLGFDADYRSSEAHQVRIEQRVIIRIAPRSPVQRQSLMAELPGPPPSPQRMVERKMEKCVDVADIAAVQTTSDDRLLLYLRDRRIVSAKLERSCRARDFYSGFYVERNEDGRICVDRDKLQSRTGAQCEVNKLRRLVPEPTE